MSRVVMAGCAATLVLSTGLATAPAAGAALRAPGVTPASVAPQAVSPRAAAVRPNARTMYLAQTRVGSTCRLQLVDRTSGATLSTLATNAYDYEDATIAPDGTVWAVQRGDGFYGSWLVRIKDGRVDRFMPYVSSVRVSPDGKRLAVTVVSPDVNHDGRGTSSVRVGSVDGGRYLTLTEWTFPVGKDGEPEPSDSGNLSPEVQTWLGNRHLAVGTGYDDAGKVSVVSADVPSNEATWATVSGDWRSTTVAKKDDATAIVPLATYQEGPDASDVTGYDILEVTPSLPRGRKIAHLQTGPGQTDAAAAITAYLARTRVTVVDSQYGAPRYAPVKGVSLERVFLGR